MDTLTRDDLSQKRAELETQAARMARNGTMSVDEFMGWYTDKDVRRRIFTAARLCEDNVNTASDLRQDAWAEVCKLPPGATREAVLKAANRGIHRLYEREWKRRKRVQIILDAEL